MKRAILASVVSLGAILTAGVAVAETASERAPLLRVTARFTPSSIVAGQQTTFSWFVSGGDAAGCEITGVPGLDWGDDAGSFVLTPTTSLSARVVCEGIIDGQTGIGRATLTVAPGDSLPVVNAAFSPASVFTGQSTTFTWSSQYASSCTSTGPVNVTTTAGSSTLNPTSNQSVTVTCTNASGSTSKTASVTVSPPPPVIHTWSSPFSLQQPGWATIFWNSYNTTGCSPYGPSGSIFRYFSFSSFEVITCWGPGGTQSAVQWVHVWNTSITSAGKAQGGPDLSKVGMDVKASGVSRLVADFNQDGIADALVVDANTAEASVVLGQHGRGPRIAKMIGNVTNLQQITAVTVPAGGSDEAISVSLSQ
ncbi:hypothetical protein [Tahibacter amnicola]|uniref:VCBS repeat protein n=1 Tax=Tahibacter amnicola TaxID=2976241 RepID=A0ABY6BJG8_9GAMM|nr:hypothetical protein [Tahibacter amnicola]UXI70161.1 hypothetical protein N4264_11175 [Tahibacter amnicola]